MPFTEAQLVAQLDPTGGGRTVTIAEMIFTDAANTQVFAVGVIAPFAGRSRWVSVAQSNTPAQAATVIQNALQA